MCRLNTCIVLLITICLPAGLRAQQRIASKKAKLDSIFTALYQTGQFTGNVLIAENGSPIYSKSFGLADQARHIPLNPETQFLLGSVSKQFTAMGIVLLRMAGELSYEDTLTKYIPELPYPGITIRQVLNHTSGLPDYDALMRHYWDKNKYATNTDMLAMLVKYHPAPFFKPGEQYLYSNTGYALLAIVIERITKLSFQQFMERNVFKPLGMNRTIIYTRRYRPRTVTNYALGYVYQDSLKQFVLPDVHPDWKNTLWEDGIYGEDGVNSTVGDLLKWDEMLFSNKYLPVEEYEAILTPGKTTTGASDYGFGWHIINPGNKGRIAYHSGGWPGYIAYNEQHLDQNQTIIILRNKYATKTRMPIDAIRMILNADNK